MFVTSSFEPVSDTAGRHARSDGTERPPSTRPPWPRSPARRAAACSLGRSFRSASSRRPSHGVQKSAARAWPRARPRRGRLQKGRWQTRAKTASTRAAAATSFFRLSNSRGRKFCKSARRHAACGAWRRRRPSRRRLLHWPCRCRLICLLICAAEGHSCRRSRCRDRSSRSLGCRR